MSDAELIFVASALMVGGLLASLVAGRLRIPGLVLFIGLGMLVGSDGLGWIDFEDYELARTVGVVALALILFEGGSTPRGCEIRLELPAELSGEQRERLELIARKCPVHRSLEHGVEFSYTSPEAESAALAAAE